MSKESIEKIVRYYKAFGPMLRMGTTDPTRPELYGMHIGYQGDDMNSDSASKLMEKKIIREADIQDGQQILDAGCGMGTLVFEIGSLYPNSRVYGIDLLDEHVSVANRYKTDFHNVSFSRQDYLSLAFRDNSFDRIFFSESLVHAQDKRKLLSEAYRILKPEGKIIIADIFTLGNLTEDDEMRLVDFNEETGIPKFENLDDIIRQLQDLGFQNILPQNITGNIASTIPSGVDELDLSVQSNQSISPSKLKEILSVVGELFSNGNAAYFILKASAHK